MYTTLSFGRAFAECFVYVRPIIKIIRNYSDLHYFVEGAFYSFAFANLILGNILCLPVIQNTIYSYTHEGVQQ